MRRAPALLARAGQPTLPQEEGRGATKLGAGPPVFATLSGASGVLGAVCS